MFDKLFSDRGLSLDRLRALIEIHDAGGIAKAAPGDLIRQSQYSRQLRELSEFFGVEVSKRVGRQLKLTPQGSELAELARAHFQSLEDFRAACKAESVDYHLGAGDSLIQWLVIPRLGRVFAETRGVRLATQNLRTNDIVRQLDEGRLDFGLMRREAVPKGLRSAPLGRLTFSLVIPKSLLGRRKVPPLGEALRQFPLASHTSDGVFTERLRELGKGIGGEFAPLLLCQSFPQAAAAVKAGACASVLPSIALSDFDSSRIVSINGGELDRFDRDLSLAWSERLVRIRPGARKVVETLSKVWRLEAPSH